MWGLCNAPWRVNRLSTDQGLASSCFVYLFDSLRKRAPVPRRKPLEQFLMLHFFLFSKHLYSLVSTTIIFMPLVGFFVDTFFN